jgi:hypothetical protein
MEILSSYDLHKGKTTENKFTVGLVQPIQMLRKDQKDEAWKRRCMDWYEHLGLRQLKLKQERIIKNYKLARGVIDKTDYVKDQENPYGNILSSLLTEESSVDTMSLDNFPIITNVVNTLMGEFSKRTNKLSVEAVDPFTKNEKLEAKYKKVEEYALQKAKEKLYMELFNSGYKIKDEEELAKIEEDISTQVKSLPEVETIFKKNYRTTVEQWAQHQLKIDEERFKMFELENTAFYDYLATDSEYWHIDLRDTDYNVEVWEPRTTFAHKSPTEKYVSKGDCVGRCVMLTIPDVIDAFGYKMTGEQIKSLEKLYTDAMLPQQAGSSPSDYYDTSKGPNDQAPNSIHLHKLLASGAFSDAPGSDQSFFQWINSGNPLDPFQKNMVRVTQVYFKTQQQVGKLTSIDEFGEVKMDIVTEDFIVTNHPVYDTSYIKEKKAETLMFGEHVEWFWINQVYGGTKINMLTHTNQTNNNSGLNALYLGVEPIKFQFKSEGNLWGNRLPVEGITCTDVRLNRPFSFIDLMKPYQIIYNLVNNQNKDMLIDEIGTVILLEQNFLPKSSMGEDWGKNNLGKAYVAMKNFQMLPLDTSTEHLEGRNSFSHFQQLNLEQTNRFISRLKIGEWAKQEAFAAIGITPQRLGDVSASESATGVDNAVKNSHTQTEHIFVNHSNFLMPRVREAMIEAAQFYHSNNATNSLQYTTEEGENIMFEIEGYKLLPRDIQVYTNFRPYTKVILDSMKSLAIENNTTGATIYDLLKIVAMDTPSQVLESAQVSVQKFQEQEQQKRQHEQEMLDKQLEAQKAEKESDREFVASEKAKDREASYAEKVVGAMGFANESDLDANKIPDVLEVDKFNASISQFEAKLQLEKQKANNQSDNELRKYISGERDRVSRERIANKQIDIARINTSKSEIEAKKKANQKK